VPLNDDITFEALDPAGMFQLPTFVQRLRDLVAANPTRRLAGAKADAKSFFRQFPIRQRDWGFMGHRWLGVLIIHIVLIQPLSGRPMLSVIMLTIALSIVMRAVIEILYGVQSRTLSTPMPTGIFIIGDVRVSQLHLVAAGVSWLCMAAFGAFFKFTSVGLLMRATADGHEAALVSGVNVKVMNRLAWAIGAGLAAIGGLFLGQLQIVSTELEHIGLLALPAVVIGGMQSIPGAIIGGLLVGLIEQLSATYISPKSSDILVYVLLLAILMVRPWGLFGQRELGRV
jgi:branched-chain amino acid transport system permease protein